MATRGETWLNRSHKKGGGINLKAKEGEIRQKRRRHGLRGGVMAKNGE